MRPIFTSMGMSINKSANTGAISNHRVCLKVTVQKSQFGAGCQLLELLDLVSMKKVSVQSP